MDSEILTLHVDINDSPLNEKVDSIEQKITTLKKNAEQISQNADSTALPGYGESLSGKISDWTKDLDNILRVRQAIEHAGNSFEKQDLISAYQRKVEVANKSIKDLVSSQSLIQQLTDSLGASMSQVFSDGLKGIVGQLATGIRTTAQSISKSVTTKLTDKEIVDRYMRSPEYGRISESLAKTNPGIFTQQNMRQYLLATVPMNVPQYMRQAITGNSQVVFPERAGSFRRMLPEAFQSIPVQPKIIRTLGSTRHGNETLNQDEITALSRMVRNNRYAADAAVQAGIISKQNGALYFNHGTTHDMINAMASFAMRDVVSAAKGEAKYGITDVSNPAFWKSISNKQGNNNVLDGGLATMRAMQDAFGAWLNPGYYKELTAFDASSSNAEYLGRITHSPRKNSRAFAEYTLEMMEQGAQISGSHPVMFRNGKWIELTDVTGPRKGNRNNIAISPEDFHTMSLNDSMLQRMVAATPSASKVGHNEFSDNMIYLKYDDALGNPSLSQKERDAIAKRYGDLLAKGYDANGHHYIGTRIGKTHAEFMRSDIVDDIGRKALGLDYSTQTSDEIRQAGLAILANDGYMGGSLAGRKTHFDDFKTFAKTMYNANNIATEGESLESWLGTDRKMKVVVGSFGNSDMDGSNWISDRISKVGFQGRSFGGKATYVPINMEDLRLKNYQQIQGNDETTARIAALDSKLSEEERRAQTAAIMQQYGGDLIIPKAGVSGGNLVIPKDTDIIEDVNNIKYFKTVPNMTQAQWDATRTEAYNDYGVFAKTTYDDANTSSRWLSKQVINSSMNAGFRDPRVLKYFDKIFYDELSRLDNDQYVRDLLFNGDQTIDLQSKEAQQKINNHVAGMWARFSEGDRLLPTGVFKYAMAAPNPQNVINNRLLEAGIQLTPEQEALQLQNNDVISMESLNRQLGIIRFPATKSGNVTVNNVSAEKLLASGQVTQQQIDNLARTSGIVDTKGLYFAPNSPILKLLQGEDFDGDLNGYFGLSDNAKPKDIKEFTEVMRIISNASDREVAEIWGNLKPGTPEFEDAVKRQDIREKNRTYTPKDKIDGYDADNPYDRGLYLANIPREHAMMGSAERSADMAALYYGGLNNPQTRSDLAQAIKDYESQYNVVSTNMKTNERWNQTEEQAKAADLGLSFSRMFKYANEAVETAGQNDESVRQWTGKSKAYLEDKNIDQLGLPSMFQGGLMGTLIGRAEAKMKGQDPEAGVFDWNQVLNSLAMPEGISKDSEAGKFVSMMRAVRGDFLTSKYLVASNETVDALQSQYDKARLELASIIDPTQLGAVDEMKKYLASIGGTAFENFRAYGPTVANIGNAPWMNASLQQLADKMGVPVEAFYSKNIPVVHPSAIVTTTDKVPPIEKKESIKQEQQEQPKQQTQDTTETPQAEARRLLKSAGIKKNSQIETLLRGNNRDILLNAIASEDIDELIKLNDIGSITAKKAIQALRGSKLTQIKTTSPEQMSQPVAAVIAPNIKPQMQVDAEEEHYLLRNLRSRITTNEHLLKDAAFANDEKILKQLEEDRAALAEAETSGNPNAWAREREKKAIEDYNSSKEKQQPLSVPDSGIMPQHGNNPPGGPPDNPPEDVLAKWYATAAKTRYDEVVPGAQQFAKGLWGATLTTEKRLEGIPESIIALDKNEGIAKSYVAKLMDMQKNTALFNALSPDEQKDVVRLLNPDTGLLAQAGLDFSKKSLLKSENMVESLDKINAQASGTYDGQIEALNKWQQKIQEVEEEQKRLLTMSQDPKYAETVRKKYAEDADALGKNIEKLRSGYDRFKDYTNNNHDIAQQRQEFQINQLLRQHNAHQRARYGKPNSFLGQLFSYRDSIRTQSENDRIAISQRINQLEGIKPGEEGYEKAQEQLVQLRAASEQAESSMSGLSTGFAVTGKAAQMLGDKVSRFVKMFGRQLFMKAINEAKKFAQEFDKSMTTIQMITLKTDSEMAKFGDQMISKAQTLKVSISEVTKVAEILARQGLNDQQINDRLDTIIKFSKVSGANVDASSKLVTVAINTGLVSNAQEATDIVAALGDNAATNAAEIEKGIEKAGAAAAADGTTFAQLASMLTAITSTTQIGGNVAGRTLNTIFGRMNKIGTNELIYDENGHAISGSDIAKLLAAQGINMYDAQGNKRSSYDVLYDLSKVWESMGDAEQQQIANAIAGTRQYSNFAAIMMGMSEGKVDEYMQLAEGSGGIVDKKYEEYLKSLEATLNSVKTAWDSVVKDLVDKGALQEIANGFIGLIRIFGDVISKLAELKISLPVILTVVGALMGASYGGWIGAIIGGAGGLALGAAGQNAGSEYEEEQEEEKRRQERARKTQDEINKRNLANQTIEEKITYARTLQEQLAKGELSKDGQEELDNTLSEIRTMLAESATDTGKAAGILSKKFGSAGDALDEYADILKRKQINDAKTNFQAAREDVFGKADKYQEFKESSLGRKGIDISGLNATNLIANQWLRGEDTDLAKSLQADLTSALEDRLGSSNLFSDSEITTIEKNFIEQVKNKMHSGMEYLDAVNAAYNELSNVFFSGGKSTKENIEDYVVDTALKNQYFLGYYSEELKGLDDDKKRARVKEILYPSEQNQEEEDKRLGIAAGVSTGQEAWRTEHELNRRAENIYYHTRNFNTVGEISEFLQQNPDYLQDWKYLMQNDLELAMEVGRYIDESGNVINPDANAQTILDMVRANATNRGARYVSHAETGQIAQRVFAAVERGDVREGKLYASESAAREAAEQERIAEIEDSKDERREQAVLNVTERAMAFDDLAESTARREAEEARDEAFSKEDEARFKELDEKLEIIKAYGPYDDISEDVFTSDDNGKRHITATYGLDDDNNAKEYELTLEEYGEYERLKQKREKAEADYNAALSDIDNRARERVVLGNNNDPWYQKLLRIRELLNKRKTSTATTEELDELDRYESEGIIFDYVDQNIEEIEQRQQRQIDEVIGAEEGRLLDEIESVDERVKKKDYFSDTERQAIKSVLGEDLGQLYLDSIENETELSPLLNEYAKRKINNAAIGLSGLTSADRLAGMQALQAADFYLGDTHGVAADYLQGFAGAEEYLALRSKEQNQLTLEELERFKVLDKQLQNYTRDYEISIEVEGVKALEDAGEVLAGTTKLIEEIKKNGSINIQARIDFESSLNQTEQRRAMLENGTVEEQIQAIAAITGRDVSKVRENFAESRELAYAILGEKESDFAGTLGQMYSEGGESRKLAEQWADEYGYEQIIVSEYGPNGLTSRRAPRYKRKDGYSPEINRERLLSDHEYDANELANIRNTMFGFASRNDIEGYLDYIKNNNADYKAGVGSLGEKGRKYFSMLEENEAYRVANNGESKYTEDELNKAREDAIAENYTSERNREIEARRTDLANNRYNSAEAALAYSQFEYERSNELRLAAQSVYGRLTPNQTLSDFIVRNEDDEDLITLLGTSEYQQFERAYAGAEESERRRGLAALAGVSTGRQTRADIARRARYGIKQFTGDRNESVYGEYIRTVYGDEVYEDWKAGKPIDLNSDANRAKYNTYMYGTSMTAGERTAQISRIINMSPSELSAIETGEDLDLINEAMSGFSNWAEYRQMAVARAQGQTIDEKRWAVLNKQLEEYQKNAEIDFEIEGIQTLEEAGELLEGTTEYLRQLKKDGRFEIQAIVKLTTEYTQQGQIDARLNSSDMSVRNAAIMEITGATEQQLYEDEVGFWADRAQKIRNAERGVTAASLLEQRAETDESELEYFDKYIAGSAGYTWVNGVAEKGEEVDRNGNILKDGQIIGTLKERGHYEYTGAPREARTGYRFERSYTNTELAQLSSEVLTSGLDWNQLINATREVLDENGQTVQEYVYDNAALEALKSYNQDLYEYLSLDEEQRNTEEGQNILRRAKLKLEVEGISQLEEAGKLLQGTTELVEQLQKGGKFEIEARIKLSSDLYEQSQLYAMLNSGNVALEDIAAQQITGITGASYYSNRNSMIQLARESNNAELALAPETAWQGYLAAPDQQAYIRDLTGKGVKPIFDDETNVVGFELDPTSYVHNNPFLGMDNYNAKDSYLANLRRRIDSGDLTADQLWYDQGLNSGGDAWKRYQWIKANRGVQGYEFITDEMEQQALDEWLREEEVRRNNTVTSLSSTVAQARQAQYALDNGDISDAGVIASFLDFDQKSVEEMMRTDEGKQELQNEIRSKITELFQAISDEFDLDLDPTDLASGKDKIKQAAEELGGAAGAMLQYIADSFDDAGELTGTSSFDSFDKSVSSLNKENKERKEALAEIGAVIESGDYSSIGNKERNWGAISPALMFMVDSRRNGENFFTDEMVNTAYQNELYGRSSSPKTQQQLLSALFGGDLSAEKMISTYNRWLENPDEFAAQLAAYNSIDGVENITEAMISEENAANKTAKAVKDFNQQVDDKQTRYLKRYGDATDKVADYTSELAKGAKSAVPAMGSLLNSMNKLGYQNSVLRGINGKAGAQLSSDQLDVLSEVTNIDKNVLKSYGADMIDSLAQGAREAIDQQWAEEIAAPMVEQVNRALQGENKIQLARDIQLATNLDTGEVDVSALAEMVKEYDDALYNVLLAYAGTGATLTANLSGDGESASYVWDLVRAGAGSTGKKPGGGGGGGKSKADKLLEEQKHRIAALEHEDKMLDITKKRQGYINDDGGYNKTLDDQIKLQERLRSTYAQNIAEMEELLAKTKENSDDWWKLKEAIYSAQEAMASVRNTIDELNHERIDILNQKQQRQDAPVTHLQSMLQTLASTAMSEDRFADYMSLTEDAIQATQDQKQLNDVQIAEWESQLLAYEEGSDSWIEVRDNIWKLEEENAQLENQAIQQTLELNQQRLSQIARALQENTATATHNNNIASTFSGIYQTGGYRNQYENMIKVQQNANAALIEQNLIAEQAVREQMAILTQGSTAWFEAQAAMYQYEEAVAQTMASQEQLNRALAESQIEAVNEQYGDATRELTHVNELLKNQANEYLETNDFSAYFEAMNRYLDNMPSLIDESTNKLNRLQAIYNEGMASGTLDLAMQRTLLDAINEAESERQNLILEQAQAEREVNTKRLDNILEEQSLAQGNYDHNIKLVGYEASRYQNAGEFTNYGRMLEEETKLRQDRVKVLQVELEQLEEEHEHFRDGSEEEKRIVEAIKQHEEALASESIQIDKNNKLLEENRKKILQVRKTLQDAVDKEIEDQKKREREILSANVSMQNNIVEILRKSLQKQWELRKKDLEQEKESLNEYKKLINERFNYRKKAADQADKDEELADYRRQLALIEADPTRSKDAKELRRKIEELEEEKAWTIAEDELNAENDRIDDQIEGIDKFIQYNEELLNEILGDANNFATEMNSILTGSFEESYEKIMEFMSKENEAFMKSLPDAQKQMIQGWEDTWKKANDIIDNNYILISGILTDKDTYMDYMRSTNRMYRSYQEVGDQTNIDLLEKQWSEYYDNYIASIKDTATFTPDDHTLGDVVSKIDELKDNIFQVNIIGINGYGPEAYGLSYDGTRYTDFSYGQTYSLNDYAGMGKVIEPEPVINSEEKKKTPSKQEPTLKEYLIVGYGGEGSSPGALTSKVVKAASLEEAQYLYLKDHQGATITDTSLYKYAYGGLVDFTGPAWVDGTKSRPESFLDAADTELLRAQLDAFSYIRNLPFMSHIDPSNFGDSYNVGDVNITINEAEINNDMDINKLARQVGQAFTRELRINGVSTAGYAFS